MPLLELVVSAEQGGRTVRSLLKYELGLSTTRINRLKRTDTGLTANGRRVFTNAVRSLCRWILSMRTAIC